MNKKLLVPAIISLAFVGIVSADNSSYMSWKMNTCSNMSGSTTNNIWTTCSKHKEMLKKWKMNVEKMKMWSWELMKHWTMMWTWKMNHMSWTWVIMHDRKMDKIWSLELNRPNHDIKMWSWNMNWVKNNIMLWTLKKTHELTQSLISKIDKLYTSNTEEITALNAVLSKIDITLASASITDSNKQIYTHIRDMITKRINEL